MLAVPCKRPRSIHWHSTAHASDSPCRPGRDLFPPSNQTNKCAATQHDTCSALCRSSLCLLLGLVRAWVAPLSLGTFRPRDIPCLRVPVDVAHEAPKLTRKTQGSKHTLAARATLSCRIPIQLTINPHSPRIPRLGQPRGHPHSPQPTAHSQPWRTTTTTGGLDRAT